MGVTQGEVGGQTEKGERQYKMHSGASYEKCFERPLENGQNLTQSCPTRRAKAGFLINQVLFGYLLKFVVGHSFPCPTCKANYTSTMTEIEIDGICSKRPPACMSIMMLRGYRGGALTALYI